MAEDVNLFKNNSTNVRIKKVCKNHNKKDNKPKPESVLQEIMALRSSSASTDIQDSISPLDPLQNNRSRTDFLTRIVEKVNLDIFDDLF